MNKVYTASKLCHSALWIKLILEHPEIHFTARWPFLVGKIPDTPSHARKFWQDDIEDIRRSDILLLYAASPEEKLRGALVEAGAAMALGKKIVLIGEHPDYGTWKCHPLVRMTPHIVNGIDLCARLQVR